MFKLQTMEERVHVQMAKFRADKERQAAKEIGSSAGPRRVRTDYSTTERIESSGYEYTPWSSDQWSDRL